MDYTIRKKVTGGDDVHYACPGCGAALKSKLYQAGEDDTCPHCENAFVVPGADKLAEQQARAQTQAQQRDAEKARKAKQKEVFREAQARQRDHEAHTRREAERTAGEVERRRERRATVQEAAQTGTSDQTTWCSDCGGIVSKRAATCPHCGAPIKKSVATSPPGSWGSALIQAFSFILLIIIALMLGNLETQTTIERQPWEYMIGSVPDDEIDSTMRVIGAQGWELVNSRRAIRTEGEETEGIYEMIFKRPMSGLEAATINMMIHTPAGRDALNE